MRPYLTLIPLALLAVTAAAFPTPANLHRRATGNKKGLGYNDPSYTTAFGNSIGWAYDWQQTPEGTLYPGVEYVPMLWGLEDNATWADNAAAAIKNGSTALLGYNEPDIWSQSDIDAADAAAGWKRDMEPFAGQATLVSPAISNTYSTGNQTSRWMTWFLGNCTSCTIDAIAMHWYGQSNEIDELKAHFDAALAAWDKPIWVTEFNCDRTEPEADKEAFLKEANAYFEKTDGIERYAAFGAFAGRFVNSNGSLTAWGEAYKDYV